MITAHATVTTDGSCVSGLRYQRGPGGWAAIIEDGSDGHVLRGQVSKTTSTKMELIAAIKGLSALPDGRAVKLVYDCTTIMNVYDRWQRHELPSERNLFGRSDGALWLELAGEFARLEVQLHLLLKGEVCLPHRRAHMIAQAQARALARGEDGEQVPLPQHPKRRLLVHAPGCTLARCVDECPFWVRELRRLARL